MERLTEKSIGCFGYDLINADHSEQEFGNYDAFYNYSMAVKKLGEYEDAEENGLLIRLPCKVGDKAYIIVDKIRVYEMEVMGIYPFGVIYEDEEKEISRVYNLFLDGNVYYKHCTFYDIGKTVFLTKAEAEQALAKMKGE